MAREEVDVSKRAVVTGEVRVGTRTHEREEQIEESLRREEITVERVPMAREVAGPIEPRQEGDTLVVSVVEEEVEVRKRFVLREEIRIRRRVHEEPWRETVRLREQEAFVERRRPPEPDAPADPAREGR